MLVGNEKTISVAEILLAFAVFFLFLIILRSFRKQIPPGLRRPPGPIGYPLIGNILEVGKDPHLSLSQMKEKYGDVMKIHIGVTPVVVLSGLETIKQALLKQGEVFMGRPDLNTFRILAETQSFIFGRDSGVMWHARKKMVQNALKTFSSSPSLTSPSICLLEEHVSQEASYLVSKFLQVMKEEGRFDPFQYMVVSVANVICALLFGKRYNHGDEELLSITSKLEEIVKIASLGNLADFIPGLQYLPWMSLKRFKTLPRSIYGVFAQKHVNNHYETFSKDHIRDITDSLIAQSQEKKLVEKNNIQPPEKEILNLVNDLLGAGKPPSFQSWGKRFVVCCCVPSSHFQLMVTLMQTYYSWPFAFAVFTFVD
ncbi:cytochrome P450 1A5-like [Sceloporus undulatus]|uniref:cytochrome P450 1A5-like n=1 Tax=Sceloporus undulatus TaxID=8520 RepID=UPI001C4C419F|nr:cytochrome P450 1A5-like [Sceloporus undulatus]